jgi:uncharacterized protein
MPDHAISLEPSDLEALAAFLESDEAPSDCMTMSELDGFLTGIAVGPELVPTSEWLPLVWGDDSGSADDHKVDAMLTAIVARYNEILGQVEALAVRPILWIDRDGSELPFDWAYGFMEAVGLRVRAWRPLLRSETDSALMFPIHAFCVDENDMPLCELSREEEDALLDQASEILSSGVNAIAAYWREKSSKPLVTHRNGVKIGRNDPCPCGSGKKYKKCCGRSENSAS